jgi:hypothetical protein
MKAECMMGTQHVAGMGMFVCVLLWRSSMLVCLFLQFVIAQDLHRRGPQGGPQAPAPGQEGEVTGVWRAMRVVTTQVSTNTGFFSDKRDASLFLNSFLCPSNPVWIMLVM